MAPVTKSRITYVFTTSLPWVSNAKVGLAEDDGLSDIMLNSICPPKDIGAPSPPQLP